MLTKIAKNLVDYSLDLSPGDKLNIIVRGQSQNQLGKEVERYAKSRGIKTRVGYENVDDFEKFSNDEYNQYLTTELKAMRACDACVLIVDLAPTRLSDYARERRNKFSQIVHFDCRCKKKWVLTSVPCIEACGSQELVDEMLDVYLKASSVDYAKMEQAMDSLVLEFSQADKVRIVAKGTDLTFSVKGMPIVKCVGKRNLPDGEVYSAPIRDSVNGYITYNMPSVYNGIVHSNIYFEFKNGKIVNASSSDTEELLKVLDTDEGARYIGEFSFGLNPFINKCYNNTLYDEKTSGTIHLTPGNAYERCNNGNKSLIHWDIVQSHNKVLGGGEIWFDDKLIRKDGLFIPENLKCLNPENLAKYIVEDANIKQK